MSDGLPLLYAAPGKIVNGSPVSPASIDPLYRVFDEADVLLDEDEDGVVVLRDWFDERCRLYLADEAGEVSSLGTAE